MPLPPPADFQRIIYKYRGWTVIVCPWPGHGYCYHLTDPLSNAHPADCPIGLENATPGEAVDAAHCTIDELLAFEASDLDESLGK